MQEIKIGKKKIEVKPISLKDRCELNDLLIENMDNTSFTIWIDIIKKCTKLSDEELNELSTDDILKLAEGCVNIVNKKK
jgi:hypothetical protein